VPEAGFAGRILVAMARSVEDRTFSRLKACPDCRWIFYDKSRSKTRVWCGMYAGGGDKILLATDGSEDADLAARAAIELSNRTASELHVVHVWHAVPTPHLHSFVRAQLRQEAQEVLQKQLERIEQSGGIVAEAHLREGRTVDEILDLSEEMDVGLLVVGSRGLGGVGRILLGSISGSLVHHARRPVLGVRGGQDS
jgi:nucleotide-binding universal stress UspA family protein